MTEQAKILVYPGANGTARYFDNKHEARRWAVRCATLSGVPQHMEIGGVHEEKVWPSRRTAPWNV